MMNFAENIIKDGQTSSFILWCREFEEAHIPLSQDLQLLFAFSLLAEHCIDEADRVTSRMTSEENREEWNAFTERNTSAAFDYFLIKSYITVFKIGGATEVGEWLQKGFDLHVRQNSRLYLLPLCFNKKEPVLVRPRLGRPQKVKCYAMNCILFRQAKFQFRAITMASGQRRYI